MNERTTQVERALAEAARALVAHQDTIRLWEPWIVYFLDELEAHAAEHDFYHPTAYETMLHELRDHIELRLRFGNW